MRTANLLRQLGLKTSGSGWTQVSHSKLFQQQGSQVENERTHSALGGPNAAEEGFTFGARSASRGGDMNVRLWIAGDGEIAAHGRNTRKALHLESRVEFLGRVPWDAMSASIRTPTHSCLQSARLFGTQVLEAMGHGLPVLTLDHQGVGTLVPANAAIKIPVTTPGETVKGIADGIRWLRETPRQGSAWARRAGLCRNTNMGEACRMESQLYDEVLRGRTSPNWGPCRIRVLWC